MTFSHRDVNICLICGASLCHHTLCMGKFGLVPITACIHVHVHVHVLYIQYIHVYITTYFTGWQKKKECITTPILKPVYDQKPFIFGPMYCTCTVLGQMSSSNSKMSTSEREQWLSMGENKKEINEETTSHVQAQTCRNHKCVKHGPW